MGESPGRCSLEEENGEYGQIHRGRTRIRTCEQAERRGVSATEVDNLIDRAFDHAPLPASKQGIAFEIWNVLHATGTEITYPEKCRYVPKMEGGPVVSSLRKLFREWYGSGK